MRVVFSRLKARGVAKLSVFKIMDFLWISVTKGKIYSFWIYGKAPMYYYIEAYILIFLTYTLWLAANQDWTGDLIFRMEQATLYIISWLALLLIKFNNRIITVSTYFASQFFRKLKKELLSSKNLHMFPLHQIHWYMSIDLCCGNVWMP